MNFKFRKIQVSGVSINRENVRMGDEKPQKKKKRDERKREEKR